MRYPIRAAFPRRTSAAPRLRTAGGGCACTAPQAVQRSPPFGLRPGSCPDYQQHMHSISLRSYSDVVTKSSHTTGKIAQVHHRFRSRPAPIPASKARSNNRVMETPRAARACRHANLTRSATHCYLLLLTATHWLASSSGRPVIIPASAAGAARLCAALDRPALSASARPVIVSRSWLGAWSARPLRRCGERIQSRRTRRWPTRRRRVLSDASGREHRRMGGGSVHRFAQWSASSQ